MVAEIIQWTNQHVVKITGNSIPIQQLDENGDPYVSTIGKINETITAKTRFSAINTKEYTRIHGTGNGEWNIGTSVRAPDFAWSLEIPVTSEHCDLLRAFQMARLPFNITSTAESYDLLGDLTTIGINRANYQLGLEKWGNCYVVSVSKTPVANSDVPSLTVEGVAFRHNYKVLQEQALVDFFTTDLGVGITEAGNEANNANQTTTGSTDDGDVHTTYPTFTWGIE